MNLRPLDGTSSVNVWAMAGNTNLRVGSRNFVEALELSHNGSNGYIRTSAGNVVMQSPLEASSGAVFRGETVVIGTLRVTPSAPASSAACTVGQIAWNEDFIFVCTRTNTWKRAALSAY